MLDFAKTISEYRGHIPVLDESAYFETASTGLVPDFVHDGVMSYQENRYRKGGDSYWMYDDGEVWLLEMIERSKDSIARMINSDKTEIAFGQSATQMLTLVTEGIDYPENANIVTIGGGWIGHRYAWQKKQQEGLEVRFIMPEDGYVSADRIINACDENTSAVSVNIVESFNGYRMDIEKIGKFCRDQGILLFCDGVQAIGVLDVDVQKCNIDFMVGNDYKWMQNYSGTGFAYISTKLQSRIKHWGAGWMSDEDRFCIAKSQLTLRSDAGRFEIGYPNVSGIYGVGLVAEQYNRLGRENIERYVLELRDYCFEKMEASEYVRPAYDFPYEKEYCQVILIEIAADCPVTQDMFRKAGIEVSINQPDDGERRIVRLALHYYNNKTDIDRFFDVINAKLCRKD